MKRSSVLKSIYKVLRSILFAVILTALGLCALTFVAISVPQVSNSIRRTAEAELSNKIGSKVEIGEIEIVPFDEVRLFNVSIFEPNNKRCIYVGRLAAGINLLDLIFNGKIVVDYAEIIALNAKISKQTEDSPLNIQFIIDAFKSKDNKPPSKFDLKIHNIVIRKSIISYDNEWIQRKSNSKLFDANHIFISDLQADVDLPRIANDNFSIDIRRLSMKEMCGFEIKSLSLSTNITPSEIDVKDFNIDLNKSKIKVNDFNIAFNGFNDIVESFNRNANILSLNASPLYLSEFSAFCPQLSELNQVGELSLSAVGKLSDIELSSFSFKTDRNLEVNLSGEIKSINSPKNLNINIGHINLDSSADYLLRIIEPFTKIPGNLKNIFNSIGEISLKANGKYSVNNAELNVELNTGVGNIDISGSLVKSLENIFDIDYRLRAVDVNAGLLANVPMLGKLSANSEGNLRINNKDADANISLILPYVDYNNVHLENINIEARKFLNNICANIYVANQFVNFGADVDCIIKGVESEWKLNSNIYEFNPSFLAIQSLNWLNNLRGDISVELYGNSIDNICGNINVRDLFILNGTKEYSIDKLAVTSTLTSNEYGHDRLYTISSPFINGNVKGRFVPSNSIHHIQNMLANALPSLIKRASDLQECSNEYFDCILTINPDQELCEALKLPVYPGVPIELDGNFDGSKKYIDMEIKAPYLVQGKKKLIKDSDINIHLCENESSSARIKTTYPLKNDNAMLDVTLHALEDCIGADIAWTMEGNPDNHGDIMLGATLEKNSFINQIGIRGFIDNSQMRLNGADWNISKCDIAYNDKTLDISGLRIWHDLQYIDIQGRASNLPTDMVKVELAQVDLDYIFDILNINYVTFAGSATGIVYASNVFTPAPVARTERLFVKNLAYNNCVLGDGEMESHWDNDKKMVAINADITAADNAWAQVRGGVYVTRDSLGFNFKTQKIDIGFLQPFMKGFTSKVSGKATADLNLYGTFADVDLGGWAYADTISMKVDYTNVIYSGKDSVLFTPGKISIPHLKVYDKFGNSGNLTGVVTHDYLRNASFNFELTDAKRILCYDTDRKINPKWYGRVFADGRASIKGVPGVVGIDIDMATAPNSSFTIVLDEMETANDYSFLTFSDKKKKLSEEKIEISFEDAFQQQFLKQLEEEHDFFTLGMRLDVKENAEINLIMDPKAGDKITAKGDGPLRMQYDSASDELNIYGKYTLISGNYNFSLQDLILKNFKIEPGSSISFNGDPMQGMLDINAAYRVNTNLQDLDKSFSNDPDLNRTSVPVDAMLRVSGDIHAPEINFDIKLPTVTSDVERKVRSIISTEDMMNRQVIYLLALNRFYAPEYMAAEQGGELASVASSTLSSQLSNIIGSITDKVALSPSFKSEKSDFSDMEVDVALSSSLLNNRLFINGNIGYRDKSTSQTTFIGDFDIEYLLSKNGNLRLKAYNHFNDASYYLKSALTTQGVGVVFRKDFNRPFSGLRRLNKKKSNREKSDENDDKPVSGINTSDKDTVIIK